MDQQPESAISARRAMKVFYSNVTDPLKILNEYGSKIDELKLPKSALETLHADLKQSTNILPPSARKFKDSSQIWTIGLLDR